MNDNIAGSRTMDDEVFTELVQVLSFSMEAAAIVSGHPLPMALVLYADQEAQVRGFESWAEAATG